MHITHSTPIVRARVKNLKTVTKDSHSSGFDLVGNNGYLEHHNANGLDGWMDGIGYLWVGWGIWSNIKEASTNATNKHDFPVIPVIIIFKSVKLDELVWV